MGALAAIAAAGRGEYPVGPFDVELRAVPAALGKTELACRHVACPVQGFAEAGTHRSPVALRATVTDVRPDELLRSDVRSLESPSALAAMLSDDAKQAGIQFGIKLALLALAGGAAAALPLSFRRWRRLVGGALAGLLTFAVIGLLVQQTYDRREFAKTRFVSEGEPAESVVIPGSPS